MPKKRKRIWKKFSKKVNAVINSALGSRTVVINTAGTATGGVFSQAFVLLHLYGAGTAVASNFEAGVNDLATVKGSIDAGDPGPYQKVRFENGVLDVTFTNSGEYSLEIDVYEYYVKSRTSQATTLTNAIIAAQANTGTLPNTAAISISSRGVTPFDIPMLAADEGVIIKSKRKYYTTPGNAFNYQLRDPKNRSIMVSDMGQPEWSKKGWTRGIIALFKNIPGATNSSALSWGCTRSYKYLLLQSNRVGAGTA